MPGCDEKESLAILNAYLDQGGNFIDTADEYADGRSEEILGRGLKGRRDDVVLATKVFFPAGTGANRKGLSRKHIFEGIEASLRRLQTDYIDLYQVHCFDSHTPLEETLSALDALVRQGKVRYLGCSNFGAWQLAKALGVSALHGYARFDCLQPQYSLVCRPIEREILPLCRAEGVGVIAWSPLGGGFLSGKYRSGEGAPQASRLADSDPSHAFLGGAAFHGTELPNPARRRRGIRSSGKNPQPSGHRVAACHARRYLCNHRSAQSGAASREFGSGRLGLPTGRMEKAR